MTRIRAWLRLRMGWIPRPVRRAIVSVIGGTLLLLALIGFIVPIMPGLIFLPIGLGILAVEFTWAARWLKKIKRTTKAMHARMRSTHPAAKSEQEVCEAANRAPGAPPSPPSLPAAIAPPSIPTQPRRNAAA